MESRTQIKYIRISPEKLRRVMAPLRGRKVGEALALLRYHPQSAARVLAKALKSAAANAENVHGVSGEELVIRNLTADGGPSLKRRRPGARGRSKPILRRTAHITVVVGQEEVG
ncbi:MAG: 50S ribosomal protein L22 [Chloroflexi bacterium]|nr:50S ribosomal protein L22 [Chloroflexota bacterium]